MKKILIILLTIATLLTLSVCNQNSVDNSNIVTSATQIAYNGEEIAVSSIILKCDDKFYGIEVNEGVNFCNKNNYFTTSSGLTIILTNEDLEPGINTEDGYTSIQKLEDRLFLVVKGSDEKKVNDVFNHIFKANGEMYQMFKHDINSDWTNEVVITNDVISFSNGEDTTYIYQNPGSLSEGCYKGRIEPTVFYKQLRGIDIPITYPEDMGEDSVSGGDNENINLYKIYGDYPNLMINNYTPYSAFDLSTLDSAAIGNETATAIYNYIILSNNNRNIVSLFSNYNENNLYYSNISLSLDKISIYPFNASFYNNSNYINLFKDVINNDLYRYHFGIVQNGEGNQTSDTYFVDAPNICKKDLTVFENMSAKLFIPTIGLQTPVYNSSISDQPGIFNEERYTSVANFAKGLSATPYIEDHGATAYFQGVDYIGYTGVSQSTNGFNNHEFIHPGDYIYLYKNDYTLYIYRNIGKDALYPTVDSIYEKNKDWSQATKEDIKKDLGSNDWTGINTLNQFEYLCKPDFATLSCSQRGFNTLTQNYLLVSKMQY